MVKDAGTAAGFLTARTVQERCARMWKHNQWKQLLAFCVEEPRAREFVGARRREFRNLDLVDIKVRELFEKVEALPPPPAVTAPAAEPPAASEEVDMASLEMRPPSAAPDAFDEGVSIDLTQDLAAPSARRLPEAYFRAVTAKDYVGAARAMLAFLNTLMPGEQAGVHPLQFRELMAELATSEQFFLVVQLCGKLPAHITGRAMEDLGRKLRLGGLLQEPVQWFEQAIKDAPDERSQPALEQILVSTIRSALT